MATFPFYDRCSLDIESILHVIKGCVFAKVIWQSVIPRRLWNDSLLYLLSNGLFGTLRMKTCGSSPSLLASMEAWTRPLFGTSGPHNWSSTSMTKGWWQLLPHGWIKVNADGSVSSTRPRAAIGGVVGGPNGGWMGPFRWNWLFLFLIFIPFPILCNGWTQHMLRARSQSYQLCKMLLKPLNELKQTDGRLNLTQGVLEGVCSSNISHHPCALFDFLTLYTMYLCLTCTGLVIHAVETAIRKASSIKVSFSRITR
ncbi:hypothetical protein GOBAR_AA04458 [Gossypium barbadense]|uniref:Reverse transcriptase zinc-binding domain-containing protein n=1 Tax=Gossypium barbadense TaxID=3634 RepID=A0A2P5YKI7_GOSBA|nr:hypothetical protein GOBAR_AA04458 [Gossypium barbadense]